MKNNLRKRISVLVLAVLLALATPLNSFAENNSVGRVSDLAGGIVALQRSERSVQEWIDEVLSAEIGGTAEWYLLTLRDGGYDFSVYQAALEQYLAESEVIYPSAEVLERGRSYGFLPEDITRYVENLFLQVRLN